MTRQEARAKWIAGLRTYKQAQRALRHRDRYCCMGVLCDVLKDEVGGEWIENSFVVEGEQHCSYLPVQIVDLVGLRDNEGGYTQSGSRDNSLVNLNDEEELSLEQIADFIEDNPEKLFVEES